MSSDGFFSFGRGVAEGEPQLFSTSSEYHHIVAPYWADSDISNRVGAITYKVYTSENSPDVVNYISKFVSQNQKMGFEGKWMLVAEWKNVPQIGEPTNTVSY